MFVVTYRKIFYIFTLVVIATAIGSTVFFGLNLGIEFTGGTLTEFSYTGAATSTPTATTTAVAPSKTAIEERLNSLELGSYSLRAAGENGYILRTRVLNDEVRSAVLSTLEDTGAEVARFNEVGPTIGTELRNKAWIAIVVVVLAIIVFIAIAFRKVSEPVSSWKYGIIAIVALLHDVIVSVGVFAFLGYLFGAEIDVLFVMALLAILGYSVNDTIVVFDRVRENLRENDENNRHEEFELTVGKSLNQTYIRSINTSLTTLVVLLALFFIGAEVTQDFALVLIAGVLAGTYSSIFLATPLLVSIQNWQK